MTDIDNVDFQKLNDVYDYVRELVSADAWDTDTAQIVSMRALAYHSLEDVVDTIDRAVDAQ